VAAAVLASGHPDAGLDVASRPAGFDGRPYPFVGPLGLSAFEKLESKEAFELIAYSTRIPK
jgi:hypothetical protein